MSSSSLRTPFRFDFVGSFLRPEKLKQAKKQYAEGTLSEPEFTKIMEELITELVQKQKALGYHVITDGEFRRTYWHLDFMWGFEGIGHSKDAVDTELNGIKTSFHLTYLTGKIKAINPHPFVNYYKFLKQFEDEKTVAKYTIPAPAMMLRQFLNKQNYETTIKIYEDIDEFIKDIGQAYRDVIKQFYEAGCRNLQIDDCSWGFLLSEDNVLKNRPEYLNLEKFKSAEDIRNFFLNANNLALEDKPKDMVINTHICRGNYNSTYFHKGAYNNVADFVFARENVDGFLLEFDDERSGGFDPLAKIPGDKKVVLGLITTKTPKLEDKEKIIERINEAKKYIPLERLCLSPQCGFASCEIGNKLTEEEQWAKLRLVKEIAEEVWGNN